MSSSRAASSKICRRRDGRRQSLEQVGDRVSPRLGTKSVKERFHRLFGCLLSREAGPVVERVLHVESSMSQISARLKDPILAALHRTPLFPSMLAGTSPPRPIFNEEEEDLHQ